MCLNHLVTGFSLDKWIYLAEEKRVIPLFLSEIFAGEQQVIPTGLH